MHSILQQILKISSDNEKGHDCRECLFYVQFMETPLKVEVTNKGVIELYKELNWKLSSKWDPINAERRIELLEQNCGTIVHYAVEEVVKAKETKFMEGVANASHILALAYRMR